MRIRAHERSRPAHVMTRGLLAVALVGACGVTDPDSTNTGPGGGKGDDPTATLRIGQFNIRELTTAKLQDPAHRQVNAAVEIIGRFDAEILSINEIQYDL